MNRKQAFNNGFKRNIHDKILERTYLFVLSVVQLALTSLLWGKFWLEGTLEQLRPIKIPEGIYHWRTVYDPTHLAQFPFA